MSAKVERFILGILRDAHPNMMRAATILGELRLEPGCAGITQADFNARMTALESADGGAQVFGTGGADGAKYKITAEGLARLAGA